jgi:glucose-6-phosphate dehydrogenase assembly protein OpcA
VNELRTPSQRVELGRVGEALRALWHDCCPEDGEASVSRALTMNLVAAADRRDEDALRRALDRAIRRLPCRAFVVVLDDEVKEVHAEVSGRARVRGSGRDLVLEQIEVRCPGRWLGNAAGLIRPLLENDLPTHFYWASALPRSLQPLAAIAGLADQAVVDSARFEDPAVDLDRLSALRTDRSRIRDLTWLRLRPWRRALAEAFERFAFDRTTPTTVTVRHGRQAGAQAGALQLAQWLERKLDATVCLEDAAAGAHLEAVAIRHGEVSIEAACGEDRRIRVHVTTAAACFLPFAVVASGATEGDLLAAAIDLA